MSAYEGRGDVRAGGDSSEAVALWNVKVVESYALLGLLTGTAHRALYSVIRVGFRELKFAGDLPMLLDWRAGRCKKLCNELFMPVSVGDSIGCTRTSCERVGMGCHF